MFIQIEDIIANIEQKENEVITKIDDIDAEIKTITITGAVQIINQVAHLEVE